MPTRYAKLGVEAMYKDADGGDVAILLHADGKGFLKMLEILKYGDSPLLNPPSAGDIRVLPPEDPGVAPPTRSAGGWRVAHRLCDLAGRLRWSPTAGRAAHTLRRIRTACSSPSRENVAATASSRCRRACGRLVKFVDFVRRTVLNTESWRMDMRRGRCALIDEIIAETFR